MKKKIILLLLALTLYCFNLTNVNAEISDSADTETINWEAIKLNINGSQENVYRRYTKTDGTVDKSDNIAYIYMGENTIFCIEMGLNISDNITGGTTTTLNKGKLSEYFTTNTDKKVNIGNQDINILDAVGLLSKIGSDYYKNNNDNDKKNRYYLAVQTLIWENLAKAGVYGEIKDNTNIEIIYDIDNPKVINLDSEKNEIITKINNYYKKPNLNDNVQPTLSKDKKTYSFTLNDSNSVLQAYSISDIKVNNVVNKDITCKINSNALTCTFSTEKNITSPITINFQKKGTSTFDTVYKVGTQYQATLLSDKTPTVSYSKSLTIDYGKHNLKIIKIDEENNDTVLEGVTYQLCSDSDCKNIIDTQKTNNEGIIIFKDLNLNTDYYVKETITIDDYILDDTIKKINIKVTDNNYDVDSKTLLVEYSNKKEEINGYIQIIKTDKETKEPLEGIIFEVYDENDKVIETLKTDKNGKAKTKLLPEGTYYVKEKETLKDYILNEEKKTIEINENNKTYDIAFVNEKSPKTADTNILLVITVAICTLVCAIIIYIKKINLVKNNTI